MQKLKENYLQKLRQNMTDAERSLWYFLRAKRLNGHKFRRQHLIYPFIVDFICLDKKLIVELDGGQHAELEHDCYDAQRSVFLKLKGYRVLRFWNDAVFRETEAVLSKILWALEGGV